MGPMHPLNACMDAAEDLARALSILGLEDLPRDPAELSRLVTHHAYRTVWSSCTQSAERSMHPGRR